MSQHVVYMSNSYMIIYIYTYIYIYIDIHIYIYILICKYHVYIYFSVRVCVCERLQFTKICARLRPIIVQEKISLDGLDLRVKSNIGKAKTKAQ